MANALRMLGGWRNDHGTNFAEDWKTARDAKDPLALQVDSSRRMVSHFFFRIASLHRAKMIGPQSMRELSELDGLGIYFRVNEALERTINPNYHRWPFEDLKTTSAKFGKDYPVHPTAPP